MEAASLLVTEALGGSRYALARLISLIEDDGADARAALAALYPHTGQAHIVGVTGAPGTGKSAVLRILAASLENQRDVKVGVISRPQANIADFYREMGELFGVELRPHNRYGGAKVLRQRWQAHIDRKSVV